MAAARSRLSLLTANRAIGDLEGHIDRSGRSSAVSGNEIEYFVSENINVLISYCLKENEIRPLRWATAICVFKLLRRKIDK